MTVKFGADLSYFFWSFGTGLIVAFLYDFIRAIRKTFNMPRLIINLTDVMFLLACGVWAVLEAYYINNGEFRFYSPLCSVLAFFLYRLLMGNRLLFILEKVIKMVAELMKKAVCIFLVPVRAGVDLWMCIGKRLRSLKNRVYGKINIKKSQ